MGGKDPEHACIGLAGLSMALHAHDEARVPVPDRPVVLVVLVEGPTEVKEPICPSGMGHAENISRAADRRS